MATSLVVCHNVGMPVVPTWLWLSAVTALAVAAVVAIFIPDRFEGSRYLYSIGAAMLTLGLAAAFLKQRR